MYNCLKKIERLFYEKTGITFVNKEAIFYIKIAEIMKNASIFSCEELLQSLQSDENLFKTFIEELTVSQSFFFRESSHFDILVELIHKEHIIAPSILSLPCANGEEPYSIAIVLLQNGIESFSIDAIDINPKAIEKAMNGKYEKRALINLDENIKKRFFNCKDRYCVVKNFLKQFINFYTLNLFDDAILTFGKYDFIFCRNLFIYLDAVKKEEALHIFHKVLKPEGYLFVSFSDYFKKHAGFDKIICDNKIFYKKLPE
ncbi:CheR family methyltransferase [Nitratiruptor tergarcus]|uniref:Chemotaxis protein methyltransferase CheR n=1 Tax=Nitratiruptor tergarcus DSM 16512 TaxID=1069081 RepID=A0A1W1WTP9_9BACT|nr:CheR family methyltransferase [Nitratiruptor tergarcus]SMC09565.1 chemotaxis protein methyltransferase CheR [Nitratiruptor tergarcus DSM 16512]